jgi:hypothetical protein
LIANYLSGGGPIDINALDDAITTGHRPTFEEFVGTEASDLTATEIAAYRRGVYVQLMRETRRPMVIKAHEALRDSSGQLRFEITEGMRVVYLVRNPLDLTASLAQHLSCTVDQAISKMASGFTLSRTGERLGEQLDQVLPNWSDHVRSWVDNAKIPVTLVKFEDLVARPAWAARTLVAATTTAINEQYLTDAIEHSSFERLRAQEARNGFRERPPGASTFFRRGSTGGWRSELSAAQIDEIVRRHGRTMGRFGYLPESP